MIPRMALPVFRRGLAVLLLAPLLGCVPSANAHVPCSASTKQAAPAAAARRPAPTATPAPPEGTRKPVPSAADLKRDMVAAHNAGAGPGVASHAEARAAAAHLVRRGRAQGGGLREGVPLRAQPGPGQPSARTSPPRTPDTWTTAQVVKGWADEAADYDYASNTLHAGKVCGHYTQVVWRNTKAVGCATRLCTKNSPFGGKFPTWQLWVCNYAPPGNCVGRSPTGAASVMTSMASAVPTAKRRFAGSIAKAAGPAGGGGCCPAPCPCPGSAQRCTTRPVARATQLRVRRRSPRRAPCPRPSAGPRAPPASPPTAPSSARASTCPGRRCRPRGTRRNPGSGCRRVSRQASGQGRKGSSRDERRLRRQGSNPDRGGARGSQAWRHHHEFRRETVRTMAALDQMVETLKAGDNATAKFIRTGRISRSSFSSSRAPSQPALAQLPFRVGVRWTQFH